MKNMNNKTKKWLFVAGGLVISTVLIVAIVGKLKPSSTADTPIPSENVNPQNVVIETPNTTEKENNIIVQPIDVPEESTSSNGIDTGTNQTIQPEPKKPTYTEKELNAPNKKPNGKPVTKDDKVQEHNKVKKPPKNNKVPQGGEVNSKGETYMPGFGWIPDSGENKEIFAEDMYENGNKIGVMD